MSSSVHLLTHFLSAFMALVLETIVCTSAHLTQAHVPRAAPEQFSSMSVVATSILPDSCSRFFDFIIFNFSAAFDVVGHSLLLFLLSQCPYLWEFPLLCLSSKCWLCPQLRPWLCLVTVLSFILRCCNSPIDVILGSVKILISLGELILTHPFKYHLYVLAPYLLSSNLMSLLNLD